MSNLAVVKVGCEACPSNLEVPMKYSDAHALVGTTGKTLTCTKCKTQWNLAKIEIFGVIEPIANGKKEENNVVVTPTYTPVDLSKTKAVEFLDMITEKHDEEDAPEDGK